MAKMLILVLLLIEITAPFTLIIGGIVVAWRGHQATRVSAQLDLHGVEVVGKIIDTYPDQLHFGANQRSLRIEFETASGPVEHDYTLRLESYERLRARNQEEGQQVKMKYLPNEPRVASVNGEVFDFSKRRYIASGMCFILGGLWIVIRWARSDKKGRHRETDCPSP